MIERRSFLKALAVLPFIRRLPVVAAAVEEPRPLPAPPTDILGIAMGQPTAVTVSVPGYRTLKITGSVFLPNGGHAAIKEGQSALAVYQGYPGEVLDMEVVMHVKPGLHTYRLVCSGAVYDSPLYQPTIVVRDVTGSSIRPGHSHGERNTA
jgi:hypothetical protein